MTVDYSKMTTEQIDLINDFCKDDMRKLKQICFFIWGKRGIPYLYHDDLYDDALNVLSESVLTFNPERNASFITYLSLNIRKSFGQWYRDNYLRAKRNNLALDERGRIKRDEKGNPIIISNISFDAPIDDDGTNLCEKISCSKTVEDEIFKEDVSDNIKKYLSNLSEDQRKVAYLIMEGYLKTEIMDILHMEQKDFSDCMNGLRAYRNISILF